MKLNVLDLNKLHTFLVVAESRGISAAARRLNLTRSAVSQSVSALETSLRARLFHRHGKALALTHEGRLLHGRMHTYQVELQQTVDEIVNEEREVRGVVRIGLFLGFSRLRLARFLQRLGERHAKIRVKLLYAPHRELDTMLRAGRVDFTFSLNPKRSGDTHVRSTRLLRQELVLAGARRWAHRVRTLSDLAQTPLVDYYRSDPLINRWIRHHFGAKPPELDVRVWAATTDLVLELLLQNVGVGVLPRDLAQPYVRARRLYIVESGRPELTDFIWLNELTSALPNPLLEAFRAVVQEELAAGAQRPRNDGSTAASAIARARSARPTAARVMPSKPSPSVLPSR